MHSHAVNLLSDSGAKATWCRGCLLSKCGRDSQMASCKTETNKKANKTLAAEVKSQLLRHWGGKLQRDVQGSLDPAQSGGVAQPGPVPECRISGTC